jgi:GH18 family chitinase
MLLVLVLSSGYNCADGQSTNTRKWLTVYYPMWAMRQLGTSPLALPPWEINWTGITHVVHFSNTNVDSVPPYYKPARSPADSIDLEFLGITNPGDGKWIHWQDSLITIAHRNGVKVILNLSALEGSGEKSLAFVAADSARTQLLVNTMVAYSRRKGYDGIEVDWEPPSNKADLSRLIRLFRNRLDDSTPHGLLLISPGSGQYKIYDYTVTNLMVDQLNLQCYDYVYAWGGPMARSNVTWYTAPLYTGSIPAGMEGMSYTTRGPLQWIQAGHLKSKIGVGMPLFGYVLKNHDKLFEKMESGGDYGYATYGECLGFLGNGGTENWDDERRVPFISGKAVANWGNAWWGKPGVTAGQSFLVTYENPRSIREKVDWMLSQDFGGIMLYDLTMDWDPAKPRQERQPLVHAAVESLRLNSK